MTAYNEKIVKPLKMYCGDKEFTIGSLGLDPMYEAILYRFIKCRRRNGVVEGITVFLADITGFSHEKRYEDIPDGWTKSADFGDLCPICSKNYATKMRDMFGYDKLHEQLRNLLI